MATYPSYGILLDSSYEPESEYEDDFSQSGIQHSRQLRSQTYYKFTIVHELTLAQWNTLIAFYDAGPRTAHTLTWFTESPEVTYSVKFTDKPEIRTNLGNNKFLARVMMRGTKN